MAKKRKKSAAPSKKKRKRNSPLVLSPAEWAPLLEDAYMRIEAAVGSRELAERDLLGLLCDAGKTLPRAIGYDDVEICELLEPSFWPEHTIDWLCSFRDFRGWYREADHLTRDLTSFKAVYFFVRRKELDKLYPISGSDILPPLVGRRGPQPAHDWKKLAGRELARRASAGESVPTASTMCQWCVDQLDHHPDIGDMSDLIRSLLYMFDA
jgi:hypothetical protein